MPCHLLPSLPAHRQRARGRGGHSRGARFCSQPGEAEQQFGYAFIGVLHVGLEVVLRSSISRRVPPGDELCVARLCCVLVPRGALRWLRICPPCSWQMACLRAVFI